MSIFQIYSEQVVSLSPTRELRFECQHCGACCRQPNLIVTVTGKDILRIATALGLNASETINALDFYLIDNETSFPEGMRDIPPIMTEKGLAYVAIRKMEDGACIFLDDNKCMIYPVRPAVCRTFPFTFQMKDDGLRWGISALSHICPGLGKGEYIDKSDLQELGRETINELSYYVEFVEKWNSTVTLPTVEKYLQALFESIRQFESV